MRLTLIVHGQKPARHHDRGFVAPGRGRSGQAGGAKATRVCERMAGQVLTAFR